MLAKAKFEAKKAARCLAPCGRERRCLAPCGWGLEAAADVLAEIVVDYLRDEIGLKCSGQYLDLLFVVGHSTITTSVRQYF